MGQRSQGWPLAFPSQVLKYGFRTRRGRTGGVKVEASILMAAIAATRYLVQRIVEGRKSQTPLREVDKGEEAQFSIHDRIKSTRSRKIKLSKSIVEQVEARKKEALLSKHAVVDLVELGSAEGNHRAGHEALKRGVAATQLHIFRLMQLLCRRSFFGAFLHEQITMLVGGNK
jgi:hypothetical protein